jgi:hypothetical protein
MLGSFDTPDLAGDRDHHLFWLVQQRGTGNRHKASSGEIVVVAVTGRDIDDAAAADALLDQIADPIASLTADSV